MELMNGEENRKKLGEVDPSLIDLESKSEEVKKKDDVKEREKITPFETVKFSSEISCLE